MNNPRVIEELKVYSQKTGKVFSMAIMGAVALTTFIDYLTLSGAVYKFALIWKALLFFLLPILFYLQIKLQKDKDLIILIQVLAIFIPFNYLISIVPDNKVVLLNLTYIISFFGMSLMMLIEFWKVLLTSIIMVLTYIYFFIFLNHHSLEFYIHSLGIWVILFSLILPFVSRYNYQRTIREISLRIDLIDKNEEILLQKEEIEQQKEKLEILNDTKDKFFSILAHDLKNPIGSIAATLTYLNENLKNLSEQELEEVIKMLKISSESIYDLLINLLDWSRSQRGLIPFNPTEANLNFLIKNNLELIKPQLTHKNIQVIDRLNEEFKVYCDLPMIMAVIRNLISNAVKFTKTGGLIIIDAKNIGEFIQVSISDNGLGMDENTKNNLFKINKTKSLLGTSGETGTGLGLILCKEFVEANGGKIWVESQEGTGTTFFFTLKKYN